jgi:CBS domain-containing protein
MLVKEIMTRDVGVLPPDASLALAAQEMKRLDCGMIPICERGRIVGVITDRDIAIRGAADGLDASQTPVSSVMSHESLVYCYEDEDVADVARAMSDHQVRRVPVLDHGKRLVGVISLGDLATLTRDTELTAEVLDSVSEPSRHV